MGTRTVSIGIPTYNRLGRLQRSLPRILAQDYGDIEVVVSDNASTDGTRDFVEALAREDGRIRYFRQAENVGIVGNYCEVLRRATGEFYMHLADDDDLATDYVSACVAALEADPSLALAGGVPRIYRDGVFSHEGRIDLLDASPVERVVAYYRDVAENGIFHGVGRRAMMVEVPPIRQALATDWMYIAAIAFQGKVRTVGETSLVKHLGGTSVTMQSLARSLGLSELHGLYAPEHIIVNVFRDIAWESPVYSVLGAGERLMLAARATGVLVDRYKYRWSKPFVRTAITDIALPRDVKRRVIAWRDQFVGR